MPSRALLVELTRSGERDDGRDNAACWTLVENRTERDGVPSSLLLAVLLKRTNDDPISVSFEVNLNSDFQTQARQKAQKAFGVSAPISFTLNPKSGSIGPRIKEFEDANWKSLERVDLFQDAPEEPKIIEEKPDSSLPLEDNPVPVTSFVGLWDDSEPIPWPKPLNEAVLYKHFPWCKLVSVPLHFIVLLLVLGTNRTLVCRGFKQQ